MSFEGLKVRIHCAGSKELQMPAQINRSTRLLVWRVRFALVQTLEQRITFGRSPVRLVPCGRMG